MIRDENRSFKVSADDLYLGADFLRDHDLREGQSLKVVVGAPRGRDKFMSVSEVLEIDGTSVAEYASRAHFDSLTSLFPEERYVLESVLSETLSLPPAAPSHRSGLQAWVPPARRRLQRASPPAS